MSYYHLLTLYDGTTHYIPPEAVETIKERWDKKMPIHLDTGSIPSGQIKSFDQSSRPYRQQNLIEEVAQPFKEPVYNPDGSVQVRWVKINVTRNKWERHYSQLASYRKVRDEGNLVVIAFRQPVHTINQAITPYCTDEEVDLID